MITNGSLICNATVDGCPILLKETGGEKQEAQRLLAQIVQLFF